MIVLILSIIVSTIAVGRGHKQLKQLKSKLQRYENKLPIEKNSGE